MKLICYKSCIGKTINGIRIQVTPQSLITVEKMVRKFYLVSMRGRKFLLTKEQLMNNFTKGFVKKKEDNYHNESKISKPIGSVDIYEL